MCNRNQMTIVWWWWWWYKISNFNWWKC